MSAISDYFQGSSLMDYTQKRVQLNKTIKPSLSASEKKSLLKNISLLLNRDQKGARDSQIISLVEKKRIEIEERYSAAITESSGRARVAFQPLEKTETDLSKIAETINQVIKSYNSFGGQQISKIMLKQEGQKIGTIRDQLNNLENQLAAAIQFPTLPNIKNIVDQYNFLIELVGNFTPVHALAQGDFFEAVVAMADQLKNHAAEEVAVDSILEEIKSTIVGGKVEKTSKSKKTMTKKVSKNEAEGSGISSQGKVDVILTSSKKTKNKAINASIKSYSSFKAIHLESNTSMKKILIGEALNYQNAILLGLASENSNADIFNKAKDSFELLAYYKALTGDYYGRTKATLFILNNVKTKKVYIVEMADILKSAYDTELKTRSSFSITPNNYYSVLEGLNNFNDLFAAASNAKLSVIFSTSGRMLNKLTNTISG